MSSARRRGAGLLLRGDAVLVAALGGGPRALEPITAAPNCRCPERRHPAAPRAVTPSATASAATRPSHAPPPAAPDCHYPECRHPHPTVPHAAAIDCRCPERRRTAVVCPATPERRCPERRRATVSSAVVPNAVSPSATTTTVGVSCCTVVCRDLARPGRLRSGRQGAALLLCHICRVSTLCYCIVGRGFTGGKSAGWCLADSE